MRFGLAVGPLDVGACGRWSAAALSSPVDGPRNALVDHYTFRIRLPPGTPPDAAFERVRQRLLAYDIFPQSIFRYAICPNGPLRPQSTIVQQVCLGPFALEMATRVGDVWDQDAAGVRSAGFRYVTVSGHGLCGAESFWVQLDPDAGLQLRIEVRSRPGHALTWLGLPLVRLMQRGLSRAALRRLAASAD